MARPPPVEEVPFFAQPLVGSALTVLSGLAFLFLCMILPLVGKAGAAVPHAPQNFVAFFAALVVSFVLAGAAVLSKLARRRHDQSPPPYFSMALCLVYTVLLVALLGGLLKI
jgi:uncharacterized membrane protein SirB2